MKTSLKSITSTVLTLVSMATGFAQTGADCGCPPLASRPTVLLSTLAFQSAGDPNDGDLLLPTTTLTCDNIYILDKKIYVPDGNTLNIMPGTVIKGRAASADNTTFIIVEIGGRITAVGTETCPVVFTAEADPLDGSYPVANRGKWGGVIILGKASNNLKAFNAVAVDDGIGAIKGLSKDDNRNWYGAAFGVAADDNDNSGILEYVSIRYAGQRINNTQRGGLSLASVGKGTALKHIEVVSCDGDGFEILGGSVDLKWASAIFCDNNMFRGDIGWSGRGQFWFGIKTDVTATSIGEGGFKAEGDDDKSDAFPSTHPVVYNVTFIGNGSPTIGAGFQAKEHTEGELYNGIFANFHAGADFSKATRPVSDSYDNWISGALIVKNCSFVNNTNLLTVNGNTASVLATDNTKFTTDGNVSAPNAIDYTFAMNTATNVVSDQYNALPAAALSTNIIPPADGFFSPAPYRGAFANNHPSWLSNWSYSSMLKTTVGLVNCATDVNKDGITNNIDFLQVLGQFNQSCR